MSCQLKYTPFCQNKDCNKAIEKKCASFKPYPPRMTDKEFEVKQTELLSEIPEEFRSTLSYIAWEQGHSAGYEEVIIMLNNLISNLKEPIRKFEQRIKNNP